MTIYYIDLEPIEPRELSEEEKQWLNIITSISFKGIDILRTQITHAKVISACRCGCKSIGLKIDNTCPKFDYKATVPVEMYAPNNDGGPIIFFLHIENGYIEELEVFKSTSEPIIETINMENLTFEIANY